MPGAVQQSFYCGNSMGPWKMAMKIMGQIVIYHGINNDKYVLEIEVEWDIYIYICIYIYVYIYMYIYICIYIYMYIYICIYIYEIFTIWPSNMVCWVLKKSACCKFDVVPGERNLH